MKVVISGSIVLYKTGEVVTNSIKSFLNTSHSVKLFLIDNSPTPVIKERLADLLTDDRIEYIFNGKNVGFGAAHNIAIKRVANVSSYHLILNPDVYFSADVIDSLLSYLDKNPNVVHAMPKVLYPDGGIQYLCKKNPSYSDIIIRRFLPNFLKQYFRRQLDEFEYKNFDYCNPITNIPFLSGCFMLIRTDTLNEVDGFDKNFFLYFEDADLTRRLLEYGSNIYYPYVSIFHQYQRGTSKSLKHAFIALRSLSYYLKKWGNSSSN